MPRTIVHTPVRRHAPQAPRNSLGSFLLALSVHALLFGALWFAVQWHTVVSDAPAEAELWNIAVPPVVDLTPEPPPPPAPVVVPQQADADIVEKQQKPKPEVAPEPVPPPPPPPPQAKPAPEPVKPVEAVKPPPPKAPPPDTKRSEARAQREAEQRHQEELSRIAAQAGGASAAGSPTRAGAGAGGRGDPSYPGRIQSAVRRNIVFSPPEGTSADIFAEFQVAAPPKLLTPSGLAGWDEAVERAISRTDPFPRPSDGSPPPRTLRLILRPIDRL
jgi:colicin import membrane protein